MIHPDGQRARQVDFLGWLKKHGFHRTITARPPFAGTYQDAEGRQIVVHPRSGLSDVTAEANGVRIEAECKGGAIETRYPGRLSKLDKSMCEIVGRLMMKATGGRLVAVMPKTEVTLRIARKLAPRCAAAGIEIALVGPNGEVEDIDS
ncbi:hypothetical protein [Rhodopseudomonas sp. BR0G17]|uniref:hypothetical protein n=1 Tax=Rhodopseudomonas sp. BR0G17 TaxID=2269368 RepID=UPI001966ED8D|nr:hypothetical protein [Rhodopseudomonas sp. BR0G17]